MRWPRGTYLNGLIVLRWGLERNYRMNTDIHQLIVFLCGVERLQIAKERRSDKRSGQRGVETLPPHRAVQGAEAYHRMRERPSSLTGGASMHPSPGSLGPPSHQYPVTVSVIDGETRGPRPALLLATCPKPVPLLLRNHLLLLPGHNHRLCLPGWPWPKGFQV